MLKASKPTTLYQSETYVTALAVNRKGTAIVSAHLDGSILTYTFDSDRGAQLIARHSPSPYSLAWGNSIAVAGNDNQIIFYTEDGNIENSYDLSDRQDCHEYTCAVSNPTGDAIIFCNYDHLSLYGCNAQSMGWEELTSARVDAMYSATAIDWKPGILYVAVYYICMYLLYTILYLYVSIYS